jgi:hypothetical protein
VTVKLGSRLRGPSGVAAVVQITGGINEFRSNPSPRMASRSPTRPASASEAYLIRLAYLIAGAMHPAISAALWSAEEREHA